MTIREAIDKVDELRHNDIPDERKVSWLSNLDMQVKLSIIDTHSTHAHCHDRPVMPFMGYGPETPDDTELLIKAPFDIIYRHHLEAQVCYAQGDMDGYNSAITLYNTVFSEYVNWYNHNFAPVRRGLRFRF